MKRFVVLFALVALVSLAVAGGRATAASKATYYLSLGDSLAQGYQPIGGPWSPLGSSGYNQGYADQLVKVIREPNEQLRLVKLGCGGETTTTMISGRSFCGFTAGSQLAEAVQFLRVHRGEVALVTIDIGGNDVLQPDGGGVAAVKANLPLILSDLRDAAGQTVPIVGMTYYDPFLAQIWFTSFDLVALQAEANSHVLNGTLESIYGSFGDPVAEVDQAFSNNDTTLQPNGLPLDVQRICQWTWICTAGDIHPNSDGYAVIARAFENALP
jgi:lysophospholipase L1-like esterase